MSMALSTLEEGPTAPWESIRLLMRRPWLDDLPPLAPLPDGACLRLYELRDLTALVTLLTRAFVTPWSESGVRRELTEAPDVAAVYVVALDDRVIATASAKLAPDTFPGAGYVHWVAADPEYQGKGLGALVTIRVLQHFRDTGFQEAVLETHNFRVQAQRSYLRLGFVPEYRDRAEQLRWARVLPQHIR